MAKIKKNEKNPKPVREGCPRVKCSNGVCNVDDNFKKLLEMRKAAQNDKVSS